MYLYDVAFEDFVLVEAYWVVSQARQVIEQTDATHVIVHRTHAQEDLYYLYTREDALGKMGSANDKSVVKDGLRLHEYDRTVTLDAFHLAEEAPDRTVVLKDGLVSGFLDAKTSLQGTRTLVGRISRPATRGSVRRVGLSEPVPRSLSAEFPDKVPLGETSSLLLSLLHHAGAGGVLPVALPVGSEIGVVVQPQRGFALEGRSEGKFTVSDEEESLPLQFPLRAVELGQGKIKVLAFQEGSPLGVLTIAPLVVPSQEPLPQERVRQEEGLSAVSTRQADLSLLILEHKTNGKPQFTIRITAADRGLGLRLKPFGPIELKKDAESYFSDFFGVIEQLPINTPHDRKNAEIALGSKGLWLFHEVIPEDLRVLLWQLKDRIKSVLVESEEPWIPWELCKLEGKEHGDILEGPFFCEAFAVTRWIPGIGMKPGLHLKRVAVVVPADSNLPYAQDERGHLHSLTNGGRQVDDVPAKLVDVYKALGSGIYDCWHFTGHGAFRNPNPNRSRMVLEGGDEMTPEHLTGRTKNLGKADPLVFLNACQIGRSAMALTDIGGWAKMFLEAGAAAFLGAYWSVYDKPAAEFAKAFYNGLTAGKSIGEAVKEARGRIRPMGDPTWLAYTVFADPFAKLE